MTAFPQGAVTLSIQSQPEHTRSTNQCTPGGNDSQDKNPLSFQIPEVSLEAP